MMIQNDTKVNGREIVEDFYIKKETRFLGFKLRWFEKIRTEHLANDILITTDRKIGRIILNGNVIELN